MKHLIVLSFLALPACSSIIPERTEVITIDPSILKYGPKAKVQMDSGFYKGCQGVVVGYSTVVIDYPSKLDPVYVVEFDCGTSLFTDVTIKQSFLRKAE